MKNKFFPDTQKALFAQLVEVFSSSAWNNEDCVKDHKDDNDDDIPARDSEEMTIARTNDGKLILQVF